MSGGTDAGRLRLSASARRACLVAGGLVALAGCEIPADQPAATAFRDSAGVRIAETTVLGELPSFRWRIGGEPIADVGAGDDAREQLFGVVGAIRLDDGRIVIANGGTNELRFYDSAGRFIRAAGREGEGPGEFRSIGNLFRYGRDSLLVTDPRLRRLSVFDADGRFGRSFAIQTTAELPFANVIGLFDDGSIFAQGFVRSGAATPSGLQRYDNPLYHLDASGALVTELGLYSGSELFFEAFDGGFSMHTALFPRTTEYHAAGVVYYIAANDTHEIRVYTPDGQLRRIIRVLQDLIPVTDADVEREKQRRLERATSESDRRDIERLFRELPQPKTMPAYSDIVIDDLDNLWVGDYAPYPLRIQNFAAPRTAVTGWTVFDDTGRLLGRVTMPEGLRPLHIGNDFVLGSWSDDLDVEHIRLHALRKD